MVTMIRQEAPGANTLARSRGSGAAGPGEPRGRVAPGDEGVGRAEPVDGSVLSGFRAVS